MVTFTRLQTHTYPSPPVMPSIHSVIIRKPSDGQTDQHAYSCIPPQTCNNKKRHNATKPGFQRFNHVLI